MNPLHKFLAPIFSVFFIIGLFSFKTVSAQEDGEMPRDAVTNLYTYEKVVKIDSLSKKQLYNNARLWAAKRVRLTECGLQTDEHDNSGISGSAFIADFTNRSAGFGGGSNYGNVYVTFSFTVQCKEGRYKYKFTNFCVSADKFTGEIYGGHSTNGLENSQISESALQEITDKVHRKMKNIIFSLVETMSKKNAVAEDW